MIVDYNNLRVTNNLIISRLVSMHWDYISKWGN